MLNYCGLLYKNVGINLKKYRKKLKKKQTEFPISSYYISSIENGRIRNQKTTFITTSEIQAIIETLNITAEQLVWGEKENKQRLIAILLLSLIIDDIKTNPFSFTNKNVKKDDFFYNDENFYLYQTLLYNATEDSMYLKHNYKMNSDMLRQELKINKYVINPESDEFRVAFLNYWKNYSDYYIECFDKSFFLKEEELLKGSFGKLKNSSVESFFSNIYLIFDICISYKLDNIKEHHNMISSDLEKLRTLLTDIGLLDDKD